MPVELTIVETTLELGQTNVEVILTSASEPGPAGPGVPTGGTVNQVLTKDSSTDYDTSWQDAQGGAGGAPTDATYLVTAAHADLSAEVVVGATPGGELGGTWASPTVDATHSGSSHAAVQAAAEATAAAALAAHVGAADPHTGYRLESVPIAAADVAADVATQAELDAHVNDISAAHAASAVSADSTTLSGTGTDVQAVLEELDNLLDDHSARHEDGGADEISIQGLAGTPTELTNHLNDATDAHDASAISLADAGGNTTETDVEGAIAELYGMVGGGGLFDAYALIRDEKASGTNGGSAAATTWNTRTLNTEASDPSGIVSISSNQFTLAAGTYWIEARAAGYGVNRHKLKLRNATDASDALIGASAYSGGAADNVQTDATLRGRVTIADSKAFEIHHYTQTAVTDIGLGVPTTASVVEVYAEVEIWREA